MNVELLLKKFQVIWGHKYLSTIGAPANLELTHQQWSYALRKVTDEQIENALRRCKFLRELPPSVDEFLCECFGILDCNRAFFLVDRAIVNNTEDEIENHVLKEAIERIDRIHWLSMCSVSEKLTIFTEIYEEIVDKNLDIYTA